MSNKLTSINLVVFNGEKYIRQCLNAIKQQTYRDFEVNIFDNNSSDDTREIVKEEYSEFNLIESPVNLGTWPGHEEALKYSKGEYIVAISVDIILDAKFVEETVKVLNKDPQIGGVEAKIYSYSLAHDGELIQKTKTIDTCGFEIFRTRRIVNIGHGEEDRGQFNEEKEIFAVEGAVPVFRKQALEDIRINGHFADPAYFWYGDDLDLAWRMRIFGWKQVFAPLAIAYHDRKTTKGLAGNESGFISMRKTVPLFKRRLDWRNTTLTVIKNDFASNFFEDLPYILWRQFKLWAYFLFFEPSMFLEVFRVAKLVPNMLKQRREIMNKSRISSKEMRKWIL
jgi:GT2 family glycosyltransferase